MRKTTSFRFFKDTPLIDFQNTIHFIGNSQRDHFFLESGHFDELEVKDLKFNYVRDKSQIDIPVKYEDMKGVNYCTFKSDFEEDTRYYAYVIDYEYKNDNNVRVYLLIDGIMTYTQGKVLEKIPNLNISRQHLPLKDYDKYLWELKNNDDIIKTNTKSYFKSEKILFDDLIVVMQSSVDLQDNFGNKDDPKMTASYGRQFDKITAPLNLYACDIDDFNRLMVKLKDYAWISQNIKSLQLIPRVFMEGNLKKVSFSSNETLTGVNYLYTVNGSNTNKTQLINELNKKSYTMEETYKLFGLDPVQDRHLLRNEYTTSELYNYSGGQFFIDNGQLNLYTGLSYYADIVTGYHTEMKVYVEGYRTETDLGSRTGSYVNDSLVYNDFDDVPMLIDNFNLAMSKSANQRQLAESKLVSNRISNVMDSKANLKDRFFDAASLVSNFSPSNLFGKFTDEHEYYRNQKAEQADLALETPTITQQTTGNSFNIANDMFGIHFKYSKPSETEMKKIKKYYKLFGYELNDQSNYLADINSMTIANFVQFSGSWTIPDTDVSIIEMMKAQFENGVRLWHDNGTANPMNQNILFNVMEV